MKRGRKRIADIAIPSPRVFNEFLRERAAPAEYRVPGESGPDHQKKFFFSMKWWWACKPASAEGTTKKKPNNAPRTLAGALEQACCRGGELVSG